MNVLRRIVRPVWNYTTNILLVLACALLVIIPNHRWIIGYWHYKGQYDLTLKAEKLSVRMFLETCYHTFQEQRLWPRTQFDDQWYFYQRCEGAKDGQDFMNKDYEQRSFWTIVSQAVLACIYFLGNLLVKFGQAIKYFFIEIIWRTLTDIRQYISEAVEEFIRRHPNIGLFFEAIKRGWKATIDFLQNLPTNLYNLGITIKELVVFYGTIAIKKVVEFWKYITYWPNVWAILVAIKDFFIKTVPEKAVECGKAVVKFFQELTLEDIKEFLKLVGSYILAVPWTVKALVAKFAHVVYEAIIIIDPNSVWPIILAYTAIVIIFLFIVYAGYKVLQVIRNAANPLPKAVRYLGYVFAALCLVITILVLWISYDFINEIDIADYIERILVWIDKVLIPFISKVLQAFGFYQGIIQVWVEAILGAAIIGMAAFIAYVIILMDKFWEMLKSKSPAEIWKAIQDLASVANREKIVEAIQTFFLQVYAYIVFMALLVILCLATVIIIIVHYVAAHTPAWFVPTLCTLGGVACIIVILICLLALYFIIFRPVRVLLYPGLLEINFPGNMIVSGALALVILLSLSIIAALFPGDLELPKIIPKELADIVLGFWRHVRTINAAFWGFVWACLRFVGNLALNILYKIWDISSRWVFIPIYEFLLKYGPKVIAILRKTTFMPNYFWLLLLLVVIILVIWRIRNRQRPPPNENDPNRRVPEALGFFSRLKNAIEPPLVGFFTQVYNLVKIYLQGLLILMGLPIIAIITIIAVVLGLIWLLLKSLWKLAYSGWLQLIVILAPYFRPAIPWLNYVNGIADAAGEIISRSPLVILNFVVYILGRIRSKTVNFVKRHWRWVVIALLVLGVAGLSYYLKISLPDNDGTTSGNGTLGNGTLGNGTLGGPENGTEGGNNTNTIPDSGNVIVTISEWLSGLGKSIWSIIKALGRSIFDFLSKLLFTIGKWLKWLIATYFGVLLTLPLWAATFLLGCYALGRYNSNLLLQLFFWFISAIIAVTLIVVVNGKPISFLPTIGLLDGSERNLVVEDL